MSENYFTALASVDVKGHIEKKGKFSYLSWPFAVSELAKRHPDAEIEVREWDGFPAVRGPKGWMVQVSVTIKGVKRTQWHPILNNNNAPIMEPSVFDVNTSIQRALVKAVAMHGLGLYIYAGEDLPIDAAPEPKDENKPLEIRGNPNEGNWEAMNEEEQAYLLRVAGVAAQKFANEGADAAFTYLESLGLDAQEKAALWTRFDSKIRSGLKKAHAATTSSQKEAA